MRMVNKNDMTITEQLQDNDRNLQGMPDFANLIYFSYAGGQTWGKFASDHI